MAKIIAVIIAIGYITALVISEGILTENTFTGGISILFSLTLILFPEGFGNFTGYVGRGASIDKKTPPFMISAVGWLLLIGLPLISYLLYQK